MKQNNVYAMTATAVMAAVLCILSPLTIPIGPIPISLATLVIYFMAYILGPNMAALSVLIYLLIGLVGIPVYSGYASGPGKLFGPTGGYLIGYLLLAYISGLFIIKFPKKRIMHVIGMILATAALYAIGTVYLAYSMKLSASAAMAAGVIPFLLGDAVKIIVSLIAGPMIRDRLHREDLDV